MWRRYGDTTFAALVLAVVVVEVASLSALVLVVVGVLGRWIPERGALVVLEAAVTGAALLLAVLTVFVVVFHALSADRERRRSASVGGWVDRWLGVCLAGVPAPSGGLTEAGAEALLQLADLMDGPEGDRVRHLLSERGVESAIRVGLASRRALVRRDALENAARARLPELIGAVAPLLAERRSGTRVMAARALGRSLSGVPVGAHADLAVRVVAALRSTGMTPGVLEEALLLSGDSAAAAVGAILDDHAASAEHQRAALTVCARLRLRHFAIAAAARLDRPDDELRAAALRTLAAFEVVPTAATGAVVEAAADTRDFVRLQAVRALAFVPRERALTVLDESLGDPSWWVRGAAGRTLAAHGQAGLTVLRAAASNHPDRPAREMAAAVLRDLDGGAEPQGAGR